MNEFKYSEDTQMALNDALYANEFSFEGAKKLAVDATVTLIFIPWLSVAAPDYQVYAEKQIPKTEQRDTHFDATDLEKINDPIIAETDVAKESPYEEVLTFLKNLKTLPKDYPGIDFEVPSDHR